MAKLLDNYDEDLVLNKLKVFIVDHRNFAWNDQGGENCMSWCGSWIYDRTGLDPAQDHRGRFVDEDDALRYIEKQGGLVKFADAMLNQCRIKRVVKPRTGDVGIVEAVVNAAGDVKPVAAICYGPLWAFITPGRVVAKKSQAIAVWRINDAS